MGSRKTYSSKTHLADDCSNSKSCDNLPNENSETMPNSVIELSDPTNVSDISTGHLTTPVDTNTLPVKTPKKSDVFQFKTPVKASLTTPQKNALLSPRTPKSRHIPASSLQPFSPRGSRLAIPLTPSRKSPSCTPNRNRHASSIDTPILNTPSSDLAAPSILNNAPVTPNCKDSPAPSYYTPSPSPRSQQSVPSPIPTPGLKFLQEEGERLSQSEDSRSPSKGDKTSKRKTFRNLFKKSLAGKELGSLLEHKISTYPFGSASPSQLNPDNLEPFKSPAGQSSYDYTSSPQIMLGRPSPNEEQNHASFVSPNRTCYLSPTGVALSSTVLGFHQSPAHTDSDNTDLENDGEEPKISQSKEASKVSTEAANDTAVLDPEESIEAIENHLAQSCPSTMTRCLSDESNTASLTQQSFKSKDSQDLLDRISPEFPDLHLSDDSDSGEEASEVNLTVEKKKMYVST